MAARLDYRWHLRQVMAARGMFSTTDLIGPLADREITLSSSQVYRAGDRPAGAAEPEDPHGAAGHPVLHDGRPHRARYRGWYRPAAWEGRWRGCGRCRHRRPAPEAGQDHRRRAVTGSPAGPGPGGPAGALLALMAELEPALSAEAVLGALGQAAARPGGRRRIAAAVAAQPDLLTGQGARAPFPGVLRSSARLPARAPPPWSSRLAPAAAGSGRSTPRSRACACAAGAAARPGNCAAAGAGR
jgi:hypothetical protein